MIIGGTSPNAETAIVDYGDNPVFVAAGDGMATINGDYPGIYGVVTTGGGTPMLLILPLTAAGAQAPGRLVI